MGETIFNMSATITSTSKFVEVSIFDNGNSLGHKYVDSINSALEVTNRLNIPQTNVTFEELPF